MSHIVSYISPSTSKDGYGAREHETSHQPHRLDAREDQAADVVVVGGGIAGSAMATVLARNGLQVVVLERQRSYRDRVRGEYLAIWGVEEAQHLGLLDDLVAAGGVFARQAVNYDETCSPAEAEAMARDNASILPGVPGPLCMGHPVACAALSASAERSGARVLRGVEDTLVTAGIRPRVEFDLDGSRHVLRPRLVIGADGRHSSVRSQIGVELFQAAPTHTIAGLLVDGVPEWPGDVCSLGTEGDIMYYVFPQQDRRVRLYACRGVQQRDRFAGPNGPAQFLRAFGDLACLPLGPHLAAGTPIGPCATVLGQDTWTDTPFCDGVVLIGDAAGYNDPIIGQGLALSLRDVRVLSRMLLENNEWTPAVMQPYAVERRERMRRLRFTATIMASLYTEFGPSAAHRRKRFFARLVDGGVPEFRLALAPVFVGPDRVPPLAFEDSLRERVLRYRRRPITPGAAVD